MVFPVKELHVDPADDGDGLCPTTMAYESDSIGQTFGLHITRRAWILLILTICGLVNESSGEAFLSSIND